MFMTGVSNLLTGSGQASINRALTVCAPWSRGWPQNVLSRTGEAVQQAPPHFNLHPVRLPASAPRS